MRAGRLGIRRCIVPGAAAVYNLALDFAFPLLARSRSPFCDNWPVPLQGSFPVP